MAKYRVKSGKHFPKDEKGNPLEPVGPGGTVDLTEAQAKAFGDKVELAGKTRAPEVSSAPSRSDERPASESGGGASRG